MPVALTLKSGNAVILRGGSDSVQILARDPCLPGARGSKRRGLPVDAIQLVPTTDRAAVGEMLRGLDGNIDVIVPRGGKTLVARVQDEAARAGLRPPRGPRATPIIDKIAPTSSMAINVTVNAKMRRTGICGATETLLVHKDVVPTPSEADHRRAGGARLRNPRRRDGADADPRRRSRRPRRTGTPNTRTRSSPSRWLTMSARPSPISNTTARTTPRRSSPKTRRRSQRFFNEIDSAILAPQCLDAVRRWRRVRLRRRDRHCHRQIPRARPGGRSSSSARSNICVRGNGQTRP